MQCDICHRPGTTTIPLNCEFCAQGAIYQPRIALVQSLMKNENLEQQVERQILPPRQQKSSFLSQKSQDHSTSWTIERAKSDKLASDARTEDVLSHTKALRTELQHVRMEIARRKARLARRRKDLASAQEELSRSRKTGPEPVQSETTAISQHWEILHRQTANLRLAQCAKTARLFSLSQEKRPKGAAGRDVYSIGFLPIPDLRELNNTIPIPKMNTILLHLANLVHLTSHHLSLKLPAQIILPSSSYPHPSILSPNVSYNPSLLGSNPAHSSHTSPTASRHVDRHTPPRARPLSIKKQLSALAKDEPRTHATHIEGITLLAWDIAWLCRTQGLDIGRGSWEEVCAMGRNLWMLLLAPGAAKGAVSSNSSGTSTPRRDLVTLAAKGDIKPNNLPPPGFFSHGAAYGFLGNARGVEYMRDWRLVDPIRVIKRVLNMLLAERTGAEWEILEDIEWQGEEEEREQAARRDQGVQRVNGIGVEEQTPRIEDTGVLVKPMLDAGLEEKEDERGKGGNGWMKIRGR